MNIFRRGIGCEFQSNTITHGRAAGRDDLLRIKNNKHLILSGPHTQPYFLMYQAGFFDKIGKENVVANLDDAIIRIKELLIINKLITILQYQPHCIVTCSQSDKSF